MCVAVLLYCSPKRGQTAATMCIHCVGYSRTASVHPGWLGAAPSPSQAHRLMNEITKQGQTLYLHLQHQRVYKQSNV